MYFGGKPGFATRARVCLCVAGLLSAILSAAAADIDDCRKLYLKGDYAGCIKQATQAINDRAWDEQWSLLLAKSQMAVGKYPEAETTIVNALQRYGSSFGAGIQVRLLACDVFNANGKPKRAADMLDELASTIQQLSSGGRGSRLRAVLDGPNMVALGEALLLLNAEPRLILENFFDQVKRIDPNYREAYLATGELALEKHDYALAAKAFNDALKKFPDDPEAQFGLARAYAPSDAPRMGKAIESVLDANPNHVPAMLLLVDHLVDAEEYDEAGNMLDRAFKVNPWDPEAWAYRAVVAHLRSDADAEKSAREKALKYWSANPRVDQLIGAKLSQNYRFQEGSEHQRQALQFNPHYLPAKIQLAQDLLRLGQESEGWRLADEVNVEDGYDVTAYNLVNLHDVMAKFATLTNAHFIVRMNTNEAALYGDRVLELLEKARTHLTNKYGLQLDQPTTVEIFPEQKDFGVRTFGMPHNPGFLGVCFGHVVTANSPHAQSGHPENWEAVLWHEFTHVITLNLTRNKMPRWLSEGISVYEERQTNPAWGQTMNSRYREMVLSDDLTPVGELSSAFMTPKSPMHVQFAYYESSLVVEFIVQKYGVDSLKKILRDLGDGLGINYALTRNTESLDKLEKDFATFARDRAKNLAPGLDWKKPAAFASNADRAASNATFVDLDDVIKRLLRRRDAESDSSATNTNLASGHPPAGSNSASTNATAQSVPAARSPSPNYWELLLQAQNALAGKEWAKAKVSLNKLVELYPNQTGSDSVYPLLAAAHRELNETNQEREVLIKLAALEADATEAYLRLMEFNEGSKDWTGVATNAERYLAVNPLVPQPYRHLARASEQLNQRDSAIRSYERLLLLDPPDPADIHYRLARLLHEKGDAAAAKRQVLKALEEAPRFPDALRLLLQIEAGSSASGSTSNGKSLP